MPKTAGTVEVNPIEELLESVTVSLPNAPQDVVEKIVIVYNGKRTARQMFEIIKQLKEEVVINVFNTDDFIAQILLDKTTVRAASKELKTIKNKEDISKFQKILGFSEKTKDILAQFYASAGALMSFDEEMSSALAEVGYKENPETPKALEAIKKLEEKALTAKNHKNHAAQNKEDITHYALKYNFPFALAKIMLERFNRTGARHFKTELNFLMSALNKISQNEKINSFLAAKVLCGFLTIDDAQKFTEMSKELTYLIDGDDIFILGCRYLRTKTAKEVRYTLDAILKRLPFAEIKEENLGLAVSVLIDGTQESLEQAMLKAQKAKDMYSFRKSLAKYDCFDPFTYEISKKFAGVITAGRLVENFNSILNSLPFCSSPAENNDLACKVLLNKIKQEEAVTQATYRRNLKAKSLTEGLAPEVLKKYLGTMSPEDIIAIFDKALSHYSFWKTDSKKHLYALEAVIAQLNGTSTEEISRFVLESLEEGQNMEEISDTLMQIPSKDKLKLKYTDLKNFQQDGKAPPPSSLSDIFN
ncbi:hypothetical protein Emin_1241 [Elusimicrobium minutum Pei191]|uniref:Uncharacterized protein n=1 Tax=Elusimicrobium minutum (strain Pei191) TaxID=445932 RepID=B2KE45_ELUMP|nr:hypothetical protein [Elusimicrobium minutum]ACC98791.1 hypothetical protein Emin_1241 [Elusimicrobium minutum Pei191]